MIEPIIIIGSIFNIMHKYSKLTSRTQRQVLAPKYPQEKQIANFAVLSSGYQTKVSEIDSEKKANRQDNMWQPIGLDRVGNISLSYNTQQIKKNINDQNIHRFVYGTYIIDPRYIILIANNNRICINYHSNKMYYE